MKETYFINPGELIFSKEPIIIKTVLGSCVGVCLYDKKNGFAGLCHYLLPGAEDDSASTKYGNVAIPLLIKKFLNNGSQIRDLEASVFGGAFILFDNREFFFIGDKNIDIAYTVLRKYRIFIRESRTGGEEGLRIYFDTELPKIKAETITRMNIDDLYRTGDQK